jgi:hypothetical protein
VTNVLLLYRFSVFSQWYRLPGDEGKAFEQRVAMACGNETPILENITAFTMPARLHRVNNNFQRFPAGLKPGEYDLTLSIRTQGELQWPQPVASYPISVTDAPRLQPQTPQQPS